MHIIPVCLFMSYLSVHIYLSSYLPICLLYPFIGPFISIHSYHTCLFIHIHFLFCSVLYLPVFLSSHLSLKSIHRSVHIYPCISYLSVYSCHTYLYISTGLPIFPSVFYIHSSVRSYLSIHITPVCLFISICLFISTCLPIFLSVFYIHCDAKLTKIPKRDFIFARVKTGQVGI